jgi:O-antigen/teichoic acid export membrane protein
LSALLTSVFADPRLRDLARNSGRLLSGNALSAILALISISLTARTLGSEQFGILILVSTYALLIDGIFNFQSWQALIKFGSEALSAGDTVQLKGLIKLGAILDCSTAVGGTVVAIALAPVAVSLLGLRDDAVSMMMVYSATILANVSGVPLATLRLFGRFSLSAAQQVGAALIRLLGVVAAVVLQLDLWGFVLIWAATQVLGNLLLILVGARVLQQNGISGWWKEPSVQWRKPFRFAVWTNITGTLDLPVKQFDVVLVGALTSLEAVSVYKLIKQVGQVIVRLLDPIYQSIFPLFASQVASGESRQAAHNAIKVGALLATLFVPILIVAGLTSRWWLVLLLGEYHEGSAWAARVYLVGLAVVALMMPVHPLLIAMGYARLTALITLTANVAYLVAAVLLGLHFGLIGIAGAYLVNVGIVATWKSAIVLRRRNEDSGRMHQYKSFTSA